MRSRNPWFLVYFFRLRIPGIGTLFTCAFISSFILLELNFLFNFLLVFLQSAVARVVSEHPVMYDFPDILITVKP